MKAKKTKTLMALLPRVKLARPKAVLVKVLKAAQPLVQPRVVQKVVPLKAALQKVAKLVLLVEPKAVKQALVKVPLKVVPRAAKVVKVAKLLPLKVVPMLVMPVLKKPTLLWPLSTLWAKKNLSSANPQKLATPPS